MTVSEIGTNADDEFQLTPAQRLAISRERMRLAMETQLLPSRLTAAGGKPSLHDRALQLPGVGLVLEVIETWWARHPMHTVALLAGQASRAVVTPIARRKPVQLVLGAFAVGAALAWLRPWRWILKPALFAGLLPQLVSRVVANVPSASWLAMLARLSAAGDADADTSPSSSDR